MVELIPIKLPVRKSTFDLAGSISGIEIRTDDIIVVSSKYVSMSEGRLVRLAGICPTAKARILASKFQMEPRMAELVLQEADYILRGVEGFLLTIRNGMIAPNAGIDKSNVPKGHVILYPKDPFASAHRLRKAVSERIRGRVAVVIADSRLMPTRIGTTGVAVGCSGFLPVEDLRGKKDLFGKVLRVTQQAVADSIATMGVSVMGESKESTPLAIVRGAKVTWTNRKLSWRDLAVDPEVDIYLSARRDLVKISR